MVTIATISHLNYCERLKLLNLPSLQYRGHQGDMITLFNLMHDLNSSDFIIPLQLATNYSTIIEVSV